MIIKSITIKNFRSYYGENKFEFSNGLTLIIGDNGDGKTTFFEALSWLLNLQVENANTTLMSEMRRHQLEVGEQDSVSVAMTFEHDGEKVVEKSFTVERANEFKFITRNFSFIGYETTATGRQPISGKVLISRCFDAFIQRYSMFKGETTLNVFEHSDALKMLVDKLSDIHEFDEYVSMSEEFEKKSGDAYEKECKLDRRTEKQAKALEIEKDKVVRNIADLRKDIRDAETSAKLFTSKIEDLERNQETSARYQELKELIKSRKEDVLQWRNRVTNENFNVDLLDKLWILAPFTSVLEEFRTKIAAFSKEKRKQHDDFIAQRSKEQGKKEAINEMLKLANGTTQLPWYLPDVDTMQEMVDDEICKVCNRPAPKGSEAYYFMLNKLHDFRSHIEAQKKAAEEKPEEKELFVNNYIEQMHNLSIALGGSKAEEISNLFNVITDKLELLETFKGKLKDAEIKLQEAEDDKQRLLIQADGISEEQLDTDFFNLKGYFERKGKAEKKLTEYTALLKEQLARREEIEAEFIALNPGSSMARIYQNVHSVLSRIAEAFKEAKETNLTRFLHDIEDRANEYLNRLNTNDFHGIIRIVRKSNDATEIKLLSSNNTLITDPSGSQLTTMYMAVLFAISDLTSDKRDENYPLIFDAPTSSFGGIKESGFYNIIDNLEKQCIIVTKDFLNDKGEIETSKIHQLTCSVYRIKKQEPFNDSDLSTIRTIITPIK
jgi:DNA sulfur modification protein DndD